MIVSCVHSDLCRPVIVPHGDTIALLLSSSEAASSRRASQFLLRLMIQQDADSGSSYRYRKAVAMKERIQLVGLDWSKR